MDKSLDEWRNMALTSSADMQKFITWFVAHKAPVIQDSMLRSIREECGLGSPPSTFTCETANSMLKNQAHYKRSEMFEFLEKLKQLISEQDREAERALIGRGKYELRPQYVTFHVPEVRWFAMSVQQREQHLKKFSNASVLDVIPPSDVAQSSGPTSECPGESDNSCASSGCLDVHVGEVATCTRIPLTSLEGIWKKAEDLLNTEGAIVSAPGVGNDAKFVLSYSGRKPHLVVTKKGGSFACDEDCPNWCALGDCAHSVAVASMCGKLSDFVSWLKKKKKLTKYAQSTMPKGRGRKGSQCPRKRKTRVPTENIVANRTLSGDCEEEPTANSALASIHTSTVTQINNLQMPCHSQTLPTYSSSPWFPHKQADTLHGQTEYMQTSSIQMPRVSQSNFQIATYPACPWFSPPPPPPYMPYTAAPPPNMTSNSGPTLPPPSPYTLCKITGNISVCAGCQNKYPKHPIPPDDLCIKHQEWREYISPGSQTSHSRFGNVYYHFKPPCVWLRCPYFVPNDLEVPPEVGSQLDASHKRRLQQEFIYLP